MADKNEPSEQTKALLERTRAQKAKQGDTKPTVTVIEDAKPVNTETAAATAPALPPVQAPAPLPDDAPVQPRVQNTATDNEPAASNDEFKVQTRTMSRTEAERERGRQLISKNEAARARAQASRKEDDKNR